MNSPVYFSDIIDNEETKAAFHEAPETVTDAITQLVEMSVNGSSASKNFFVCASIHDKDVNETYNAVKEVMTTLNWVKSDRPIPTVLLVSENTLKMLIPNVEDIAGVYLHQLNVIILDYEKSTYNILVHEMVHSMQSVEDLEDSARMSKTAGPEYVNCRAEQQAYFIGNHSQFLANGALAGVVKPIRNVEYITGNYKRFKEYMDGAIFMSKVIDKLSKLKAKFFGKKA